MSERPSTNGLFVYTQRDVANTALSVSSLAAIGATAGTAVVPGIGSVVGGLVGGIAGLVVERLIDRKPASEESVSPSS
jgi:outer membrane lipoprotein SlyB